MPIVRFQKIWKFLVITSDAFVIGEVDGIRYDPQKWQAGFLLVNIKKSFESHLCTGRSTFSSSKIMVPMNLIQTINDVIILAYALKDLKELVKPDNLNIPNLGHLMGKKVVTSDNQILGVVSDINLDVQDIWPILSVSVRPDKNIIEVLGLKKPFFSKMPAIILEITTVVSIMEMLNLNVDIAGVKEKMTLGE